MPVIDVHTHMLNREWFKLLRDHGAPKYNVITIEDGIEAVTSDGARFLTPTPPHFDYALRIKDMDDAKVDIAIVSLTAPNVYFGGEEISTKAAQIVNDEMAEAQSKWPDRIRWLASVPWEYPDKAVAELKRAHAKGAVGVMVIADIHGRHLTEPTFAPVWKAIDDLALPVLVHPTAPPGADVLALQEYMLASSVGFLFDTTLAISRMIYDGFFDTYPNLKIIAAHAGATLPYIVGRLDRLAEKRPKVINKITRMPSEYLPQIYFDAVCYRLDALKFCLDVVGSGNLMYGSDYPHSIGDMKGCLARVDALPSEHVEAVRGGNATRIFGL